MRYLVLFLFFIMTFVDGIMLTDRNVISLRGRIDGDSTTNFIKKINLHEEETLYIYVTSPGGSVIDGLHIIEQIETLTYRGIKVYCIADFAASMAFAIFQACPTRYTTSASILMQHQMSLNGLEGNLYNIENYIDFIRQTDNRLDKHQAERLNLTVEKFQQNIMNDWWMSGTDILLNGASDELVRVYCQPSLVEKQDIITVQSLFFEAEVVFSKCPLIREPLSLTLTVKNNTTQTISPSILDAFFPSKYISMIKKERI